MRQIGTIASDEHAARLSDYLLTRGIRSQSDRDPNGWTIWVHDEDRVAEAKREFDVFQQNPSDAKYAAAAHESKRLREAAARKEARLRKNMINVRSRWARPTLARRPVTFALIIISSLVAFLTNFGGKESPLMSMLSIASYEIHGNMVEWQSLSDLRHGEIWRLFTPMFLHFGIVHLLFNMYYLSDLGSIIELNRGTGKFVLIVLVVSALSNLGQYYFGGPRFGGMSGVVYGLLGYVWMKGRFDPAAGMGLHPNTVIMMIFWLLLCATGKMGPVANWAHAFGLLSGMILGYAPTLWRKVARTPHV